MSLIDFILNLVALFLWLSWRSFGADPLIHSTPATLAGTLRRAEPRRLKGWHFLAGLVALLVLRAWLYWQIGPSVNWTPKIRLVAIALSFRSDFLDRMLLFSGLSFTLTLALLYLLLLLLSLATGPSLELNAFQRFLRTQLGFVHSWHALAKSFLPLAVGMCGWLLINPLLTRLNIIPPPVSGTQRVEQALLIGLGSYLAWKYLIVAILLLSLLSSYVYLGNHWFWNFVSLSSRNLLAPIRWIPLRLGKVDFTPLAGVIIVLILGEFGERGLVRLYERLAL
jgi:hypothetical protein